MINIPNTTLDTLFRPAQYEILNYQRGKVGVAAVPGSGKTFTLSHLAAALIKKLADRKDADPDAEVLIVTFTNVAVNSFKRRLSDILKQRRVLMPYVGYRIRTLHGLAHEIVRERPTLVGLSDDFLIVDERIAAAILDGEVQAWLSTNADQFLKAYLADDSFGKRDAIRAEQLPAFVSQIANRFIRAAKDRELSAETLRAELSNYPDSELPLARFGVDVYDAYQKKLTQRGAVDFDDLARLALQALQSDAAFCKRLQKRWPYILEDEAQDSSLLQQRMLNLLSGGKNWVRVGDPNQAINTTFTTANPASLRDFLDDPQVKVYALNEAGRSAQPIIDLANYLVHWSTTQPDADALQTALLDQQIVATPPGDTQPNPSAEAALINIRYKAGAQPSSEDELKFVADSLTRWLPDHPDQTVAVLVPENARGFRLVEMLRERQIDYEELLSSTTNTRAAAELLHHVLGYLAAPVSSRYITLTRLYQEVWWPLHIGRIAKAKDDLPGDDSADTVESIDPDTLRQIAADALSAYTDAESFLWPDAAQSADIVLPDALPAAENTALRADLESFRQHVKRWLDAVILPIDQLVLTINQDLFSNPADIALGYKFAALLRSAAHRFPAWRLPEFVDELRVISQNERKFFGFDNADIGYQPTAGRVTVSTYHSAKGLEWDRVYLTGVSNYVFPMMQPFDSYIGEKWFVRDGLNLEAEALAQLDALYRNTTYHEKDATEQARIDYAAEHLRLLYVGITRARRDLSITWNTGRFAAKGKQNQPALPMVALHQFITDRAKAAAPDNGN